MHVTCRICGSNTTLAFTHAILSRYDCRYYFCDRCGCLQTEEPYWLDEAYSAPIASADTGVLARNLMLVQMTAPVLYFLFDPHGRFLDAAGGYGIFSRLMRDIGFDYYWTDKYSPNLLARGFEAQTGPYGAVTAFEVLEHLVDPMEFVAELLEGTDTILFTTELFSGRPPSPQWWYYAFATGQHITFYQKSTLEFIAHRFGMRFYSTGVLHVWTRKKLNPLVLRTLTTPRLAAHLSEVPRRRLGSRTMSDHERLIAEAEKKTT
jgi:Methyltransferase domain